MSAQTPTPPPDPPPASAPSTTGNAVSAAGINISGLVDGYYSYNFNHPASKNNTWRNFDVKHNALSLNFAKLTIDRAPEKVGFKLELAAGRAMEIFHATEPGGIEVYKHIFQAYVSAKPTDNIQFDFGKFVTSAGSEVTETFPNWNYSRSLLFTNGPYYHFGARTTFTVNPNFNLGVQLVNGWNNVEDNNNQKTIGLTTGFTSKYLNWYNNYYVGNEKTDTLDGVKINAEGIRHFYDLVLAFNPNGKVNGLFNFDYGIEKNPGRDFKFYGYSAALRFLGGENFAFSPRYDWYKDRDGFITGGGIPRTLQEFTLTADYKMNEGFLTRFEYRRDWANTPFYDRGNQTVNHDSMSTVLIGFVYQFSGQ